MTTNLNYQAHFYQMNFEYCPRLLLIFKCDCSQAKIVLKLNKITWFCVFSNNITCSMCTKQLICHACRQKNLGFTVLFFGNFDLWQEELPPTQMIREVQHFGNTLICIQELDENIDTSLSARKCSNIFCQTNRFSTTDLYTSPSCGYFKD